MPLSSQMRDVSHLCPCIRAKLWSLADICFNSSIEITVYETLRTLDRQRHYFTTGVSWTMDSRHLPQPPNNLSLAFDMAPTSYMRMKWWNPDGPLWDEIGKISTAVGLKWGVWLRNSAGVLINRDKSHHELKECECEIRVDPSKASQEKEEERELLSPLSSSGKG